MLISSDTIEHIQSKSGRGHIKEQEIREVMRNPDKSIERNKTAGSADLYVRGSAQNGKQLVVCVILRSDEPYQSEVITAWEADQ